MAKVKIKVKAMSRAAPAERGVAFDRSNKAMAALSSRWGFLEVDGVDVLRERLSEKTGVPALPSTREQVMNLLNMCVSWDAADCLAELVRLGLCPDKMKPWKDAGGLLLHAMRRGNRRCAAFLVDKVDVDKADSGGYTALMRAASAADLPLLEWSDVQARDNAGISALGWCVGGEAKGRKKRAKALRMVLEKWESKHGHESACDEALRALEMSPMEKNLEAFKALWPYAIQAKDPELLRDVVVGCAAKGFKEGFDLAWPLVDKKLLSAKLGRFNGRYETTIAAQGGNVEMLTLLLEHCPLELLVDKDPRRRLLSPIAIAAMQDLPQMVLALSKAPATLEEQGTMWLSLCLDDYEGTAAKLAVDLCKAQREKEWLEESTPDPVEAPKMESFRL